MTITIDKDGKKITLEDLELSHPYSFDTRIVKHFHALDGSIIRDDTKEQFNGKVKIKTLSDTEYDIKKKEVIPKIV